MIMGGEREMADNKKDFFKTGLVKDYLAYRNVEFGEDFAPQLEDCIREINDSKVVAFQRKTTASKGEDLHRKE